MVAEISETVYIVAAKVVNQTEMTVAPGRTIWVIPGICILEEVPYRTRRYQQMGRTKASATSLFAHNKHQQIPHHQRGISRPLTVEWFLSRENKRWQELWVRWPFVHVGRGRNKQVR